VVQLLHHGPAARHRARQRAARQMLFGLRCANARFHQTGSCRGGPDTAVAVVAARVRCVSGRRRSCGLVLQALCRLRAHGRHGLRHGLLLPPGAVVTVHVLSPPPRSVTCACPPPSTVQVTFQARDLAESRYLFDQLSVISPIMVRACRVPRCVVSARASRAVCRHVPAVALQMALTAGSPVFRGMLVDTDTRWDVISSSVDCRTPIERGISTEARPVPRVPCLLHARCSH
jgi:hypothetical protein